MLRLASGGSPPAARCAAGPHTRRDAWPPGLPARAAITHAHYPGGAIGTSRPTAITPPPASRPAPPAPIARPPHARSTPAPRARAPPVPRCGSPPRCAAWQVAHAESFACRGLPAGAPRPRHGARQGRAPSAMLGPRASRLATPLPTRITRAARFAAWHLACPRCPPKKRPPKRPCKKRRIVKYLRRYARHFRQQSTYWTPCRSTVMG